MNEQDCLACLPMRYGKRSMVGHLSVKLPLSLKVGGSWLVHNVPDSLANSTGLVCEASQGASLVLVV